jgi:membrane-bound serine protease (ClpP class)
MGAAVIHCPREAIAQARPTVLVARLDDHPINPITARFIERSLRAAEQADATCMILVLDTPGGLVTSTRDIVREMLASKVPVVVYVSPSGARAASAGVFITLASHVAAMAPGTHIGAAHPVQVGGAPGTADKQENQDKARAPSPQEVKTLQDTVAWARSLAELRHRNAEWAARAVQESVSVPASKALEEGVIDLLADDLQQLLGKLDGRKVALPQGEIPLRTANAEIRTREMWWGERLLAAITNPSVAFLLLIIGFYGILFELYSPGWGVGGTIGVICLLLGFLALAILPVNYVGLGLLLVAMGLFIAEAFVSSFGLLALAGVACLVLGGLMLVDSPVGFQRISLFLLIPVAAATASIVVFLVGKIVAAQRSTLRMVGQSMAAAEAVAEEDFIPTAEHYAGLVRVHGELWQAISPQPVTRGQPLTIEDRQGLTLQVHPSQGPASPPVPNHPPITN